MDKEMDKSKGKNGCITDAEGFGTVKIANDVVAMIAGLAATEVEGVSATSGNITNELMGKVANIAIKKQPKGVKVEITKRTVSIDLALTLEYGYNIPATCNQVQVKVKSAIETMTGFTVSNVNIRIIGIKMQENK